jgi:hypothetical protein
MARFDVGWVRLDRKTLFGDIAQNPYCLALWIRLLGWATVVPTKVRHGDKQIEVPPGTVVTGLSELAEKSGMAKNTIRKHLEYLKSRGSINTRCDPHGTIITIRNWSRYQSLFNDERTPLDTHYDTRGDTRCAPVLDKETNKQRNKGGESSGDDRLPRLALIWNENCGTLPKVKGTNPSRNRKASQRLAESTEIEWTEAVCRVSRSPFCNGRNDRSWRATFDWILQPESRLKVMEGKYDDAVKSSEIVDDLKYLREKYS